jgi:hypothetical protein
MSVKISAKSLYSGKSYALGQGLALFHVPFLEQAFVRWLNNEPIDPI